MLKSFLICYYGFMVAKLKKIFGFLKYKMFLNKELKECDKLVFLTTLSAFLMFDKINDSLYSNPFSEYLTESSFYISYSVTPCLKIAISFSEVFNRQHHSLLPTT